jgi:hypothetical protein
MRTKEDVQIYYPKCRCGGALGNSYKWCRACNLVFCQNCFMSHVCRPVNGPISPKAVKTPPAKRKGKK